MTLLIVSYLAIGAGLFVLLWKKFNIEWKREATDTQLLMIAIPVLWPLVLLLILGVWMKR